MLILREKNNQLGQIFKSKEEEINKLRAESANKFELEQKFNEIEAQKNRLKVTVFFFFSLMIILRSLKRTYKNFSNVFRRFSP